MEGEEGVEVADDRGVGDGREGDGVGRAIGRDEPLCSTGCGIRRPTYVAYRYKYICEVCWLMGAYQVRIFCERCLQGRDSANGTRSICHAAH